MRRSTLLAGVTAVAVAIASAGPAGASSPSPTPVTATIKAEPDPQVYCEECIHFSGGVASPKAACRSKRTLESILHYQAGAQRGGRTHRDQDFVVTDGQGRWDIVVSPGEPLAWFEVIVPQARVGGVLCKAGRAKVTL